MIRRIGIIGLGDMGMLMAKLFAKGGYQVYGSDLPSKCSSLQQENKISNFEITEDGRAVVSTADFILFCVESENIENVVAQLGPYIKKGTVVGGQTSVKAPEIEAFEKYLSADVHIATIHSLHGPHVNPEGQTLVAINHKCPEDIFQDFLKVIACLGSTIEVLNSTEEHDKMMADIQVVTHIGFESIGTSFMHRGVFPWENPLLTSGIDNVKMLMTLRIYSYKHHVYSGLAMLNPFAKSHVRQYAQAENELFGLMISGDENGFREILMEAKTKVFSDFPGQLMLSDDVMKEYSLHPSSAYKPNSHLSLLAMVLTWARLGTNPYKNVLCHTPPFKLRVGMAEYLFLDQDLFDKSIDAALTDMSIRIDDLAFHTAVQEWAHIVEIGDKKGYESHFERTRTFLKDRLEEGRKLSSLLIERLNNE